MKKFDIPVIYRSPLISSIKNKRKEQDKLKKDFTPGLLDFGSVQFYIPRHFGFCYGVENAIEIAFNTVEENPGRRIFLLSEMIHNPHVNEDLLDRGVRFLMDTKGNWLIPIETLNADDIVIIPAFGTTLEIEEKLKSIGIEIEKYNTTCPFVEKVWNRAKSISEKNYTVIIHGKPKHEETKATFSHTASHSPSLVVKDMQQAEILGQFILGEISTNSFHEIFGAQISNGFDPAKDLERIGVVNQTTMLAEETQSIANFLKNIMIEKYGEVDVIKNQRFADTRDTLCYATNENQQSVHQLIKTDADFAIVIGGKNSSNTGHLVELCEAQLPTYFIESDADILSSDCIQYFDLKNKRTEIKQHFLPQKNPVKILMASGASCPDAIVESVIMKLVEFFPDANPMEEVLGKFNSA